MAGGNGVWGIDIGQCGLKALRGTLSADGASVVADAFDFIEYPKILSQPDAKPDELVRDALKQFLSRNDLRGDKVAISLSGQSGLARFVKLPPVEAKKIPNIVAYEAKQQIPFSLDDVIWDYQQMPGAEEEEGFALETEVGIFAMKRDQVFRAIRPLVDAEVELDVIQLTPLSIYNSVAFDILASDKEKGGDADQKRRPIVVLSMGTDTSDLVVTDGFGVWQRSIPLGGNHFTKQLTKELKLTFAKAEHVKRNARKSDDAKAIFQAMRPVFNDLVTEVHRSLGFYQSLGREQGNREPKYLVVLGNAAKLPGLPQYLEKNLSLKVVKLKEFKRMQGDEVVGARSFKDNILAFPVCYGLVLQGLGKANLRTNLLPREILRQRLIRRKKPWAAAIAAALLLGCAFNFFFVWRGWNSVHEETWTSVHNEVQSVSSQSGSAQSEDADQTMKLERLYELGEATVGSADGRLLWLELMKMVSEALPVDPNHDMGTIETLEERPLETRQEIYIDSIQSVYYSDLSSWLGVAKGRYEDELRARKEDEARAARAAQGDAEPPTDETAAGTTDETGEPPAEDDAYADDSSFADSSFSDSGDSGMSGEQDPFANGAWVIEIQGHHFYKDASTKPGASYVRNTLVKHLDEGSVELPVGDGQGTLAFTAKELGIFYPHIATGEFNPGFEVVNPRAAPPPQENTPRTGNPLLMGQRARRDRSSTVTVPAYKFTVQFAWTQVRLRQRLKNREEQPRSVEEVANINAP